MVHATGTIYTFVYRTTPGVLGNTSLLTTIDIADDGTINNVIHDSEGITGASGASGASFCPDLIKISDGVLAILWNDTNDGDRVRYHTYSADGSGNITLVNTLNGFGNVATHTNSNLRHLANDVHVAVARDLSSVTRRLRVEILEISPDGTMEGIIDGPDIIGSISGAGQTDFVLMHLRDISRWSPGRTITPTMAL
jgi:hypothetical protein